MLTKDREITDLDRKLYSDLIDFLPKILPEYVIKIPVKSIDGVTYMKKGLTSGLSIIISIAIQSDNKRWIHLSCCRRTNDSGKMRLPNYEDVIWLKDFFVSDNRKAIMIFPEKINHVNLGEVLHLFCCLDEDPLPEFSGFREDVGGGKTRSI